MSMVGNYRRVSEKQLEEILKNRESIPEILFTEDEGPDTLDIDKAWHGIHYLLTGDTWEGKPPLSYLVLGGTPLDYHDLEYGPPRYITPKQVMEALEAVNQLLPEQLHHLYNSDEFIDADIYPGIWEEDGEEALEYLLHYLEKIKIFFKEAADKKEAIVFYLF